MPIYQYESVNEKGENIKGFYDGKTKAEVIMMLKQNKNYPISIKEKEIKEIKIFNWVKTKDLAVFCRQFYSILNSGIPIINCLNILRDQIENKKLKSVISDVYEEVQKGSTFSQALKKHPTVFPQLMTYMVEAGETSGSLDIIMLRMAIHYEKESKINNKIKSAMIYPIILTIVSIMVVIFLLTVVMPTFLSMFEGSEIPLPLPTKILLVISGILKKHWYIIILATMIIAYVFKIYISKEKGVYTIDKLKLKLPLFKKLNQKIITARFSRTLSTMLSSGIPLLQSLEIAANAVGNRYAAIAIIETKEDIRKGLDIANSIKKTGLFPPMLDNMISIGQESGTLDDILDKTANFFDEEVDFSVQKLTIILEPIMILVMAVVVGFIVISMVLPMFDILQTF